MNLSRKYILVNDPIKGWSLMMEFQGTQTMVKQLSDDHAKELMLILQETTVDFCMKKGIIKLEKMVQQEAKVRTAEVRTRFQPRFA